MDNILFLDIDGVLNSEVSRNAPGIKTILNPEMVNRLVSIINQTNCSIIISSSWKEGIEKDPVRFAELLEEASPSAVDVIMKAIVGTTPTINLNFHCDVDEDGWEEVFANLLAKEREQEIELWLSNHPECKSWVILDDLSLCLPNFVQTDFKVGLTDELVVAVINTLRE